MYSNVFSKLDPFLLSCFLFTELYVFYGIAFLLSDVCLESYARLVISGWHHAVQGEMERIFGIGGYLGAGGECVRLLGSHCKVSQETSQGTGNQPTHLTDTLNSYITCIDASVFTLIRYS